MQDTFLKGVAKLDKELLILLDVEKVLDLNETNEVRAVIEENWRRMTMARVLVTDDAAFMRMQSVLKKR